MLVAAPGENDDMSQESDLLRKTAQFYDYPRRLWEPDYREIAMVPAAFSLGRTHSGELNLTVQLGLANPQHV